MQQKDEIVLQDTAYALADFLASQIPGLSLAWGLSKALLDAGLKLRQKRALEWVEMVRDNPGVFTKELLSDEQFQDGFVFALEKYLRLRNITKREFAKSIFLQFSAHIDKEKFELERFYFTLDNISLESLNYLGFIKKEIIPQVEQSIGSSVQIRLANSTKLEEKELYKDLRSKFNIEYYLNKYLPEKNISVSEAAASKRKIKNYVSEYLSLGIMKFSPKTMSSDSGDDEFISDIEFNITEYGFDFIEFLSN